MLKSITIKNIVLIKEAKLFFKNNFCALTGETGSGKSILLDALGLAIGYRSNSRLLKNGEDSGFVVAEFDISHNLLCQKILEENFLINQDDKNSLILRRIINNNGSKAFINDMAVGVKILKDIGDSLIEIHGQNEQGNLLNSAFHQEILDKFSKNDDLLSGIGKIYDLLRQKQKDLQKLEEQKDKNEREADYLRYIIKELENANIYKNEENDLVEKRDNLKNRKKLTELFANLQKAASAVDIEAISAIKEIARNNYLSNSLDEISNNFDQISVKSDEIKSQISEIINNNSDGELNFEEIEERLFLVRNLSRKLNIKSEEVPDFLEDSIKKLQIVENFRDSFSKQQRQ